MDDYPELKSDEIMIELDGKMTAVKVLPPEGERQMVSDPDQHEHISLPQDRGPTIEFTGALIAETEFDTRDRKMLLQIWETTGGALVAYSMSDPLEGVRGRPFRQAKVVRPTDKMDMQCAIMEAFDWNDRARSMARKQLGWQFKVEVE